MDPDETKAIEGLPSLSEKELLELSEELELTESLTTLERTRKSNFHVLNDILSEYLDSFIILGYTAEGDEVVFNKMKNPRDSRSLLSLLDEVSASSFKEFDPEMEE